MQTAVETFLQTAFTYGQDGIELEFRLPLVHRTLHDRVAALLEATPAFRSLGTTTTVEAYSAGDARRVTDETGTVRTLYKRRLSKTALESGEIVAVSLERWADGDVDERFPTYRKKTRTKYGFRCWEVHLTSFQTNDPRLSDQDGFLYDIELELQPNADELYHYTVSAIADWGHALLHEMVTNAGTHDPRRSQSAVPTASKGR